MDEMKLKLSTRFMKSVVAKLMSKYIQKQTGYRVKIRLDDLDVWILNGDTTVKVNLEAKLNNEDFNKIIKSIELD